MSSPDRFRPPAPAGDVEAEREELARRVAAELPQPEQPDGAIGGEVLPVPVPAALVLLRAIGVMLAMPVEDVRQHGFRHRRHHAGVDQPRERHPLRQRGVGQQLLHAHPERLDEFHAAQVLQRAGRRGRDQSDVDGRFRPQQDPVSRQRPLEERNPVLGLLGFAGEEDVHARDDGSIHAPMSDEADVKGGLEMSTEKEILALEDRRCAAMTAGDLASLEKLLHDELLYTHSSGVTDTKASWLLSMKSGKTRYKSVKCSGQQVRVFGDVALVTGRVHIEAEINGQPRTLRLMFLNAWAKTPQGWKFVAWQSAPQPV